MCKASRVDEENQYTLASQGLQENHSVQASQELQENHSTQASHYWRENHRAEATGGSRLMKVVSEPVENGTYACINGTVFEIINTRTAPRPYLDAKDCDFRCCGRPKYRGVKVVAGECVCGRFIDSNNKTRHSRVNMFDCMAARQRAKMPS
jgi:hypothetical protein